jgi:hypothetical protein
MSQSVIRLLHRRHRVKWYKGQLSNEERTELQNLISARIASARKLTRARILLKVGEGLAQTEVSQALDDLPTVSIIK